MPSRTTTWIVYVEGTRYPRFASCEASSAEDAVRSVTRTLSVDDYERITTVRAIRVSDIPSVVVES